MEKLCNKIKGNTFLITGGVSGLGEGTARLLTSLGGNIGLLDINEEKGNLLAKQFKNATFIKCDVTSQSSVEQAIQHVVKKFGNIRGVINCAGVGWACKVVNKEGTVHALDIFETVVKINLTGTFNVIRLAAKQMSTQPPDENGERGVIITVASVAAIEGQQGQAAYSASKAGVMGMTLPLARDLGRMVHPLTWYLGMLWLLK